MSLIARESVGKEGLLLVLSVGRRRIDPCAIHSVYGVTIFIHSMVLRIMCTSILNVGWIHCDCKAVWWLK